MSERALPGQMNGEFGAAVRSIDDCKRAAVFGDDSMGEWQTNSVAGRFGCEEWNENFL